MQNNSRAEGLLTDSNDAVEPSCTTEPLTWRTLYNRDVTGDDDDDESSSVKLREGWTIKLLLFKNSQNWFMYRSIAYWSLWGSTCTTCCWTRSSSDTRVHPQPLGGLRDPRRLPAGERVVDLGVWGCPPHALLPGKPERPGAPPLQDAVTGLLLCRPVLLLVLLQAGGDRGGAFRQAQRVVRKRQVPPGASEGWRVWIFLFSCGA